MSEVEVEVEEVEVEAEVETEGGGRREERGGEEGEMSFFLF